jgi:hypothetical protein
MRPWALKRYGDAWGVGQPVIRKRDGRESIEMLNVHWYGTASEALEALQRRLLAPMYSPGPHVRAMRGNVTQRRYARSAGVSVRQLRRIEAGTSDPKAITLARLLRVL